MSISRSKACEPTPSIWRAGGRKRRPELGEKGGHLGFSAWDSIHPSMHAYIHVYVGTKKEYSAKGQPAYCRDTEARLAGSAILLVAKTKEADFLAEPV